MPAYIVADIEIVDHEAFADYRERVPAVIAAYGGRYLVRGGASEVVEGAWQPRRMVILEFPTMASLKSFVDSPEYRPLRAIRERAAKTNMVVLEGVRR
jgi:uncharacterized protein (DUF1330 family)